MVKAALSAREDDRSVCQNPGWIFASQDKRHTRAWVRSTFLSCRLKWVHLERFHDKRGIHRKFDVCDFLVVDSRTAYRERSKNTSLAVRHSLKRLVPDSCKMRKETPTRKLSSYHFLSLHKTRSAVVARQKSSNCGSSDIVDRPFSYRCTLVVILVREEGSLQAFPLTGLLVGGLLSMQRKGHPCRDKTLSKPIWGCITATSLQQNESSTREHPDKSEPKSLHYLSYSTRNVGLPSKSMSSSPSGVPSLRYLLSLTTAASSSVVGMMFLSDTETNDSSIEPSFANGRDGDPPWSLAS